MERDALNQQHVKQRYAIALITSGRVLQVVGKITGWHVNLPPQLGNYRYNIAVLVYGVVGASF